MASRAFRLEMRAPLHVGDAGIGYEETLAYVPSDTLFSALVLTWLQMGEQDRVDGLADAFAGVPPLLLSSALPYAGSVRFLPKPRFARLPGGLGKEYKRVEWVSEGIFRRLLQNHAPNNLLALWQESRADASNMLQAGNVWATGEERSQLQKHLDGWSEEEGMIWQRQRMPRVAIDRQQQKSNLFHVGRVHFAPGCGLWLLASGENDWLDATWAALRLLGDSGIGGRRSRGHGAFSPSVAEGWSDLLSSTDNTEKTVGDYEVLLGRLAPAPDQMDRLRAPGSSYSLVTVGGWSDGSRGPALIRQRLNMLAEGSIVRHGEGAGGALVDVKPQKAPPVPHPIYRYGFGLGVPIRLHPTLLAEETIL